MNCLGWGRLVVGLSGIQSGLASSSLTDPKRTLVDGEYCAIPDINRSQAKDLNYLNNSF